MKYSTHEMPARTRHCCVSPRSASSLDAMDLPPPPTPPELNPPPQPPPPPSSSTPSPSPSRDDLFKSRFLIPEYLRRSIASAIKTESLESPGSPPSLPPPSPPPHPLIVMINSKSGGRKGAALRAVLCDLLSEEQVYDLLSTPPKAFLNYGLRCLEILAENGDQCAKEVRSKIRIIVAGGDGTVGWVLGSMMELHEKQRIPIPPVGIIPLGTGNDLSRSFGWGGGFWCTWRPYVRRFLSHAVGDTTSQLDSWQVTVRANLVADGVPHALHQPKHKSIQDGDAVNGEQAVTFEGTFYNYFSIGMDAQVAYGFHHLRETKPQITIGPISNKIVYSGYSCVQGWFCTPCSANPCVRGLRNVMHLAVKKDSTGDWEPVDLPVNVRAVIMLNLQSYASGRNPWGHPDEEYNKRKGFIEPKSDDGLLEVFGLFDGWHASLVMLSLRSAKRLAQGCAIQMKLVADQRHRVYMQMDGEPWRQPISEEEDSTVIEITRVPTPSLMLRAS